jgi:hypothetical protein
VVPEVSQPQSDSINATQPLWLVASAIPQRDTGVAEGTSHRSHACKLEAWVCSGCGLVEWYAKNPGELERLTPYGDARVVTSTGPGAYR